MADVLIRNIDPAILDRIDSDAARAGLSRNAYLREQLDRIAHPRGQVSMDDLRRSAELARGVLDEDLMRQAWS